MTLRLYNSLSRQVEEFKPIDEDRVTMYLCGPTVYSYVHIGNARGPVVFDVLARLLRRKYPRLVYARNITDVDDKINTAAAEAGVPIAAIAERYAAVYREDIAKLGVAPPDVEPLATQHIEPILAMCAALIASGNAYAADGHVLFDVASFPDYGRLSGRSTDELVAGARVEVAPYKRNPADFVLWKPSRPDLPGWDSPWGRGRPGWHIECSAMAAAHLGETIDIHAGGVDLVFPHHENEIAQSTCAHRGHTFARYWLHNGMLTFGGAKMSKSVGNVRQLHALLEQHPPEAIRYALLSAHYRQPLDWSDALIEQSIATLDRLYGTLRDLGEFDVAIAPAPGGDIDAALEDDLNTPTALALINQTAANARRLLANSRKPTDASVHGELVQLKSRLLSAGNRLGLLQQDPEAWLKRSAVVRPEPSQTHSGVGSSTGSTRPSNEIVEARIAERSRARAARDFARADAIRDELAALGIAIEDGPQGTRWKVTNP